jgi:branched-chain amino acid transport system substrate-binding protein
MRKVLLAAAGALGLAVAAAAYAGGPSSARPDAAASPAAADRAAITCGRTRTFGLHAPYTGQAASVGQQQVRWVQFFVSRYNASHRTKLRIVPGDGQLPETAAALQAAERLASNQRVLAVVGPAGSQEVQIATAPLRRGGLAFVTGSATNTDLTTASPRRRGYFFRTVPNDDQQGAKAVGYMRSNLRATRFVVIDAQTSYSVGLADIVERLLRRVSGFSVRRESVNEGTVTDFSSLVTRIPADTQVVYVPWQLSSKAQLFGQQLRAAGKQATLFGGDGLFDPDNFKIPGSYVSAFPVALGHRIIRAYSQGPGNGKTDLFGLPSYVAADVVARAIDKACTDNRATRAEVRRNIAQTNIPKAQSLLGFQIRYSNRVSLPFGPGDMRIPADYILYRISPSGQYVKVA